MHPGAGSCAGARLARCTVRRDDSCKPLGCRYLSRTPPEFHLQETEQRFQDLVGDRKRPAGRWGGGRVCQGPTDVCDQWLRIAGGLGVLESCNRVRMGGVWLEVLGF
jgi:hypothetical protein